MEVPRIIKRAELAERLARPVAPSPKPVNNIKSTVVHWVRERERERCADPRAAFAALFRGVTA